MSARKIFPVLGLYPLAVALVAARTADPTGFEAHTTGAETSTLRGAAEFGAVKEEGGTGRFVLTLGAEAPTGAVVFTWADGARAEPGVYAVSEASSSFIRALIVTGSPTRPTGAFRARAGTLILTRAGDLIQGNFELEAVGLEAADPNDEGRRLIVRGAFTAKPGEPADILPTR